MAGSQGSALAIAVSQAGGLGSLPCAMLTTDVIRNEVAAIRAQTAKPFNSFVTRCPRLMHSTKQHGERCSRRTIKSMQSMQQLLPLAPDAPFNAQAAQLIEELKPAVVSFHFGLPPPEVLTRVKISVKKFCHLQPPLLKRAGWRLMESVNRRCGSYRSGAALRVDGGVVKSAF